MADGFVHTVRIDAHCYNTIEGQDGTLGGGGSYETTAEAVAAGRAEARRRQTEHVIHREDGSIAERNSYGHGPAHRPASQAIVAGAEPDKRPETAEESAQDSGTPTPEHMREYLRCWQLPGGVLAPNQARALLSWDGTPEGEREALRASIAASEQQVDAKRLAPNQRRGHVGWLDRLKHLLGR